MQLKLRKRHRLIWGIMALILPVLFVLSLAYRPKVWYQTEPVPNQLTDSLTYHDISD